MPKLRKTTLLQQDPQEEQSYGKYLSFQQKQTQIPQPSDINVDNKDSNRKSPGKKSSHNKNTKRSLKKSNKKVQQNDLAIQKTSKRKSRRKKVQQSPQKTQPQDYQENLTKSPKIQKHKSSRKTRKNQKKYENTQNQNQIVRDSQNFNDNQLRLKQTDNYKNLQQENDSQSQKSQKSGSQKSPVNFNKRLKKKKPTQKEDLNMLLSRYTEDEGSIAIGKGMKQNDSEYGDTGRNYESDLRDLDLLVKKKEKKSKKQKQIRIRNKYFSDISLSQSNDIQEKLQYQGQDPPQNSEELIIQKKQPRKIIPNLTQAIQKRVNHIKDRRQFKNSQGDMKFKNHLKSKLQQVRDAEEIQVDIQIPNLFTKKTASAALYMKNTLSAEQKIAKFSQSSTENDSKLIKTSSNLESSKQNLKVQQIKQQQFLLQMKKKRVKRNDFYNHLTKEIKNKRQTNFNSQELKDCFKTSNLDGQNFDVQLAEDVLSNCSSRSSSRQSFDRLERRMSVDSQKSLKSQGSLKESNLKKDISKDSLSISKVKSSSKGNIQMNYNDPSENSHSKSNFTSKSFKNASNFINPPISEVKQSDASSSYRNFQISRNIGKQKSVPTKDINLLRFDDEQTKMQVQNSFGKTLKIFQSQNQHQFQRKQNEIQSPQKIMKETFEQQKESDKKLEEKLKKIVKKTHKKLQKKILQKELNGIEDILGDSLNEQNEQRKTKKTNKKKNKKTKRKTNFLIENYQSYFEQEADYSSSEQGHTDQQLEAVDSDLDQEGNIIGLIDKDTQGLEINERRIKKKFLEDQEKKDKEIIEKIMKGLYGRKKMEQTDSEKRLRKRMQEAAKKNLLDDLEQMKDLQDTIQQKNAGQLDQNQPISQFASKQNQNDENSRQMRKLKEMQEQLAIAGHGKKSYQRTWLRDNNINEPWRLFNPSLPVTKTIHPSMINRPIGNQNRKSVDKSKQHRKSIFDTKKGAVQQQIFNKTIPTDRLKADSAGNRNKLQKTSQIHLDIRNYTNHQEELQI